MFFDVNIYKIKEKIQKRAKSVTKYAIKFRFHMTHPLLTPRKGQFVCPRCSDMAFRVERRLRDRLLSLFKDVKRYHCEFCGWTESIAAPPPGPDQVRKPDSTVG